MVEIAYEYLPPNGDITRHIWTLVGPSGAVHIWAEPNSKEITNRWGEEFYGGIEMHSPKSIYDFGDGKPHHDPCWLLKGPCWHSGSSLQFSEQVEPFIRHTKQPFEPAIHEFINFILWERYNSWFKAEEIA